MDSLITAAARALSEGDPLGALNRIALREDPPALALRGIAMAQLGDLVRARALLRKAARAFGPKETLARARCVVAEAEIALAARDLRWPAAALEGRRTVDLCVLGPVPFGSVLEELTAGEKLDGRPFAVRRVDATAVRSCQVLFLSEATGARESVLRALATVPVLTVSDAPRFLDEGGIIQLHVVAGRVRFNISVSAATRAGLRLNAQLLQLADRVVYGGRS